MGISRWLEGWGRQRAKQRGGRGDGTLALATVDAAMTIAKAVRSDLDMPTHVDSLAFCLHVADRFVFEVGGASLQAELMPGAAQAALSLLLTVLSRAQQIEPANELTERAWLRLDQLHEQFSRCAALYPSEGVPRPTVLEAAHEELVRHAPPEMDAASQLQLLVTMMSAVRSSELRKIVTAVAANVRPES